MRKSVASQEVAEFVGNAGRPHWKYREHGHANDNGREGDGNDRQPLTGGKATAEFLNGTEKAVGKEGFPPGNDQSSDESERWPKNQTVEDEARSHCEREKTAQPPLRFSNLARERLVCPQSSMDRVPKLTRVKRKR
ncbi:MAG TPA: hypothetical protein VGZ48_10825 [Candidatus Acidoferrales bacterium]|jgi:hypothetical protein|nr:hypothetical protein [Candidatus Acidoferrales bacterium]